MQVLSSGNIASLATLSSCISAAGSSSEDKCSNKHQIVIAYLAFTGRQTAALPDCGATELAHWKKEETSSEVLIIFFCVHRYIRCCCYTE